MRILTLASWIGGCGRTTLTAALASAIARTGRLVLAVDLDPANLLPLHLGVTRLDGQRPPGTASSGHFTEDPTLQGAEGVRILPSAVAGAFEAELPAQEPRRHLAGLRGSLAQLELPDDTIVLADTPRLPSARAAQVLEESDHRLLLWRADVASYARLAELHADAASSLHVINLLDPASTLQGDVHTLFRRRLGDRLLPESVHRDEAIPEALAAGRSPAEYAPASRAVLDIAALADRLMQTVFSTETRRG